MDFVILQVNGVDVSKSSHEEALGVFLSASEPILVQMLRRAPGNSSSSELSPIKPKSTIKESAISSSPTCNSQRTCCLHEHEVYGGIRNSVQVQTDWAGVNLPVWSAIDFYHQTEQLAENDDVIEEEQEMEYEEIKLKRMNSTDKLGLTLCDGLPVSRINYDDTGKLAPAVDTSNFTEKKTMNKIYVETNDNATECEEDEACVDEDNTESEDKEVYIQAIAEDSLAAADGRLLQGDVLLQINGVDVRNRYQAENLFATTGPELTLLVSRPHNQADPLDVLSVAFPYPELDEEFLEDGESEEDVQVEGDEERILEDEENEKGDDKTRETENQQLQALYLQERHSHEVEWRQDSGFGTSSLPRSSSDQDPNEGSFERTARSRMSDGSTPSQTTEEIQTGPYTSTVPCTNQINSDMTADKRLNMVNRKMESLELECLTAATRYSRRTTQHQTRKQENEKDDSDHIYETISECLDQEPVYSTPYELPPETVNGKPVTSHSFSSRACRGVAEKSGMKDNIPLSGPTLVKSNVQSLYRNHCKRGMPRSDRVEKTNDVEQWIRQAAAVSPLQQLYAQQNGTGESKKMTDWRGTTSTKLSSSSGDSSGRKEKKLSNVTQKRIANEDEMRKSTIRNRHKSNHASVGEDRDTSSAYNTGTGESWQSAHLSPPFQQLPPGRSSAQYEQCLCCQKKPNAEWMQSSLSLSIIVSGDQLDPVSGSLIPTNQIADCGHQAHFDPSVRACTTLSCESCQRCPLDRTREPQRTKRQTAQLGDVGKSRIVNRTKENGNNRLARNDATEKNCNYVTMLPAARTMYTNAENLQQTIRLQQQLFQQQLLQKQQQQSAGKRNLQLMSTIDEDAIQTGSFGKLMFSRNGQERFNRKANDALVSEQLPDHERKLLETNTEWRMKKRADGSRYITRRPTRERLLRDRAHQISEERAGTTTDDDTLSELKLGRYWSKEERRQHVEKTRERRQRQEELIRSKIHSTCTLVDHSSESQRCPNEQMLQLGQARSGYKSNIMNKMNRSKLIPETAKNIPPGLLTVTMV